jgi:hypothetical protein
MLSSIMKTNVTISLNSFKSIGVNYLGAMLDVSLRRPRHPKSIIGSVQVDFFKTDSEIDEVPILLQDDFYSYAKEFYEEFPDFVFYASLKNRFYRDLVIARSSNISDVSFDTKGGVVLKDPTNYLRIVMQELERFDQIYFKKCRAGAGFHAIHRLEIAKYLQYGKSEESEGQLTFMYT